MPIFESTLSSPLAIALHRPPGGLVGGQLLRQQALLDELAERLQHEVRVDGGGAVADEHGDAVHAARLARLDDEPGLQARPAAHEVVVHRRHGEQRRDRRARGRRRRGRRGRGCCSRPRARASASAHSSSIRALQALGPVRDRPGDVERARAERLARERCSRSSSSSSRIGLSITSCRACSGVSASRLRSEPTLRGGAHHDRLPDRVDRRVRDLREELLEVGVEQRRAVGEHGEREVVAHRADRLLGVQRQRREHRAQILLRVAEGELPQAQRLLRARRAASARAGRRAARSRARFHVGVRPAGRDLALDLLVVDDPAALGVDEEELPGPQPALAQDVLGRDVEHAGLGGEHDPAVAGLQPAAGAQAVAVERGADQRARR